MIVCPACEHRNPEDTQVCEACGGTLAHYAYRACPSCNALNPAENSFCHRCFSQLLPPEEDEFALEEEIPVAPYSTQALAPQMQDVEVVAEISEAVETVGIPTEGVLPTVEVEAPVAPEIEELAPPSPVVEPEVSVEAEIVEEKGIPEEVSREILEEEVPAEVASAVEVELAELEVVTEEAVEVVPGPLGEELEQLLAIRAAVELLYEATPTIPRRPSEEEERARDLFGQIAREPAPLQDTSRIVIPPRVEVLSRAGRVILYSLVFLAALIPLFIGGQSDLLVRPRGSVTALADTFQLLPADSAVLISFDYGPTYAAELDALAMAVLRHLSARSVRTVVMSTDSAGIGSAEYVYRTIGSDLPDYRYGANYAILGYLPGQEAGLRTLSTSLKSAFALDHRERLPLGELPIMAGLTRLEDFQHIIVLADDAQSVRRWIEQVQSRTGVNLHALVTARIEPMLVPYRESGQLRSLIGGAPNGATEYEVASGVPLSGLRPTGTYLVGFFLLVLVAVATNIAYISGRRRGGRSKE